MELNICHLYPDLLNVYGDVGDILILKDRAKRRNINVNIINVSLNDEFNPEEMDIVFFGGGQDYEQSIVSKDLKKKLSTPLSRGLPNSQRKRFKRPGAPIVVQRKRIRLGTMRLWV